MKNIVLTACALVLAGTVSQVRAEEGESSAYGEIGTTNPQICASKGKSCAAANKDNFSAGKGLSYTFTITAKSGSEEGRRSEDSDEISYSITTTLSVYDNTKLSGTAKTKTFEWKDLKQAPEGANIATDLKYGYPLTPVVNQYLKLKVESKKGATEDDDFPYTVSGEFEDCGGTCSFGGEE